MSALIERAGILQDSTFCLDTIVFARKVDDA